MVIPSAKNRGATVFINGYVINDQRGLLFIWQRNERLRRSLTDAISVGEKPKLIFPIPLFEFNLAGTFFKAPPVAYPIFSTVAGSKIEPQRTFYKKFRNVKLVEMRHFLGWK